MIDILPGILEQDISVIRDKIARVESAVSWVHIDVADHSLVANETFRKFEDWKNFPSHLSFEAHLMVANPEKYIKPLVDAGFKRLIAHVECQDPRRFLELCEYEDIEVGLALDGPSEVEEIEPFMEQLDVALLMGIEAGFSGQTFQPETIEKVKALIHAFPEAFIEIDGGVDDKTASPLKEAGVKRLVTTSYLFRQQDIAGAIAELAKESSTVVV